MPKPWRFLSADRRLQTAARVRGGRGWAATVRPERHGTVSRQLRGLCRTSVFVPMGGAGATRSSLSAIVTRGWSACACCCVLQFPALGRPFSASSPDCFLSSPSLLVTRTEEETNLDVDEVRVLVRGKWLSTAATFGLQVVAWPELLPLAGMRNVVLTPSGACHGNLTQPYWSEEQTQRPLTIR